MKGISVVKWNVTLAFTLALSALFILAPVQASTTCTYPYSKDYTSPDGVWKVSVQHEICFGEYVFLDSDDVGVTIASLKNPSLNKIIFTAAT